MFLCLCSDCTCNVNIICNCIDPINDMKYFSQSPCETGCDTVKKEVTLKLQPILPGRLYLELKSYVASPEVMWILGYPVSHPWYPNLAIFNHSPPPSAAVFRFNIDEVDAALSSQHDVEQRVCARCEMKFNVLENGEYLCEEECFYHWGRVNNGKHVCCGLPKYTSGCTSSPRHVWNGLRPGTNPPRSGFRRTYKSGVRGVYALDVEMVYTTSGLEAARVVLLHEDGRIAYKATIEPESPIIDYNTRFSGVAEKDLHLGGRSLEVVQNDILDIVGVDTLLIGHALENDLRALKIVHSCVVDTAILYPHPRGLPWRRSLRALAAEELCRDVQVVVHAPAEDARAALDLCRVFVNALLV